MKKTPRRLTALEFLGLLIIPGGAALIMIYGWPLFHDDLYLHLKAGQWIVDHKNLLHFNIFSYCDYGKPDEIHSWLAQVFFWSVYYHLGDGGLLTLNILLVGSILAFAGHFLWQRTQSFFPTVLGMTLVVLVHHYVQVLRPLLFGEFFFALIVFELLIPAPLSGRRLLGLLAATLAWSNFHGSVILVVPIVCAYAFTTWFVSSHHNASEKRWTLLSPVLVFATTLLNPSGIKLYVYAWEVSVGGPKLENWEWKPLTWNNVSDLRLPHLILLGGTVFALIQLSQLFRRAPKLAPRLEELALNLLFLPLPLFSRRHLVFLLYPAVTATVEIWQNRKKVGTHVWTNAVCLATSLTLLATSQFFRTPYQSSRPRLDQTASFIDETQLSGNLFNWASHADFLIFRLFPQVQVALDSRTWLHQRRFEDWHERAAREGFPKISDYVRDLPDTDMVLVANPVTDRPGLRRDGWICVYENNAASLWLKAGENLEKVARYYKEKKIPFEPQQGFDAYRIYAENPNWLNAQEERPDWGKWPRAQEVELWDEINRSYRRLNKLPES